MPLGFFFEMTIFNLKCVTLGTCDFWLCVLILSSFPPLKTSLTYDFILDVRLSLSKMIYVQKDVFAFCLPEIGLYGINIQDVFMTCNYYGSQLWTSIHMGDV